MSGVAYRLFSFWSFLTTTRRPPPGEEPLCRIAVLAVGGRRLQGITRRVSFAPRLGNEVLLQDLRTKVSDHGASWVVSGSRLLPAYRTATGISGSPPAGCEVVRQR
jgi:hypothetical protein